MIKKHNNKNDYVLTKTGLWVRDFTKQAVPVDINRLLGSKEYQLILDNEINNAKLNLAGIDSEIVFTPNVVIVSDGYKFDQKMKLLSKTNATIIGTNGALSKWNPNIKMDWYVVNNPYRECVWYLNRTNYFPKCIASVRTNPEFTRKYVSRGGVVYRYSPTPDEKFRSGFFQTPMYYVDDYRNPICAAMCLAHKWGVQRLLLLCCDDSFEDERPGSVRLKNGLWTYPQHQVSHGLIETISRLMPDVKVADHSFGPEYESIQRIEEDDFNFFFEDV